MTVYVDEDAEREIGAAFDWYEERGHTGLGARFVADLDRAFARIPEAPSSFLELLREGDVHVRRVLLRDFPFQVVFGEVPTARGPEVWVFAVRTYGATLAIGVHDSRENDRRRRRGCL